jgi:hypothetical protein
VLAEYPRPETAENGKRYYWPARGYPVDRYLEQTKDEDLLAHMGVPTRFHHHVVAMYEDPLGDEIEDWIADMPYIFRPPPSRAVANRGGQGLLLYGRSGTRKTTTAAAVLLRLVRMGIPNLSPNGHGTYAGSVMGRFVDWQDASELFRRAVGNEQADEDAQYLRSAMRCEVGRLDSADILVLDDISRERTSEFNVNELHRVLRFRNNECRPAIVTTNHPPKTWPTVYGETMAAFMERAFEIVQF